MRASRSVVVACARRDAGALSCWMKSSLARCWAIACSFGLCRGRREVQDRRLAGAEVRALVAWPA